MISNIDNNSNVKPYKIYVQHQMIGKGGYGSVYDVSDKATDKHYALKSCSKIFNHTPNTRKILRELMFGRLIKFPYIVSIEEILMPANINHFNTIWFITDLMDMDLKEVIKHNKLSLKEIQYIMYQLLQGVNYLHKSGIMHRDLKPENVLINKDYSLKISDFGLARLEDKNELNLTSYTVTRWYRAPEILLECNYDKAIDMWSIGCILGELLLRKTLFPGNNNNEQLELLCGLLGTPDIPDWIDNPISIDIIYYYCGKGNFNQVFANYDPEVVDLLSHLLEWDPNTRYTAEQSLEHPFFKNCDIRYNSNNNSPIHVNKIDFGFKEDYLDKEDLREKIVDEIKFYHPEI